MGKALQLKYVDLYQLPGTSQYTRLHAIQMKYLFHVETSI